MCIFIWASRTTTCGSLQRSDVTAVYPLSAYCTAELRRVKHTITVRGPNAPQTVPANGEAI